MANRLKNRAKSPKKAARRGRPRNLGPFSPAAPAEIPASLPLPEGETPLPATVEFAGHCPRCGAGYRETTAVCSICDYVLKEGLPEKKPYWWRPADSEVRKKAVQIVLMRAGGLEDEEIAKALGIGRRTVSDYVHKAAKNGWLESLIDDPKEKLEYGVLHKVVRNIDQFLDSEIPSVRQDVTMEVFKGTIAKKFAETGKTEGPSNSNVLQINVVMPPGPPAEVREGTTGGVPAYIDGEILPATKE